MTIVIDIEEKVNSEIAEGHTDLAAIEEALAPYKRPFSELCKLYITDSEWEANKLYNDNFFVVPVLTPDNAGSDFSRFKYLITDPDELDINYYYKIWQRLLGLPWHILETESCLVREMTIRDTLPLYEVYSDPSVTQYTEPLFPAYEDELEYTRNYIHNVYEYFGFGTWIVELKKDHTIIGRAGFNYRPGVDIPELGYVLSPAYQHKGYAYEVCKAILDYATEELDFEEVLALSSPANLPSLRLLKRLGFSESDSIEAPDASETMGIPMTAYIYRPLLD